MSHENTQSQELAAKLAEVKECITKGRVIDIAGEIKQGDERKWLARLEELVAIGDAPIVVRINTPGGSIKSVNDFGMEVGNMQAQGKAKKIYTLAHNHCASAGTYMLISLGTSGIFSTPNTKINFHGSVDPHIQQEARKGFLSVNWALDFLLTQRNPYIEWNRAIENDHSFSAESARSTMLIDGIVTL